MKTQLLMLSCLFFVAQAHAQAPMSQADAFAAGQATGSRTANTAVFNNINATTGTAKVDGYSNTPAEKSYWGVNTPIGPVMSAGASKITGCAGAPSNDPRIRQQCEAILALEKQRTIRPPGLITATDPLIVSGDAITANPEAIAGSITGAYSACTTETTSLGQDKTTETCDEYSSSDTKKCTVGTQVTVDADHLFKCLDSQRVQSNASCTVGRVITVDADANYQCTTTNKVHQNLTCNRTYAVTTARAYKGMAPDATFYSFAVPAQPVTSGSGCEILYQWPRSTPGYVDGATLDIPAGYKVYVNGTYRATTIMAGGVGAIGDALHLRSPATSANCGEGWSSFAKNQWYLDFFNHDIAIKVFTGDSVEIKMDGNCPANFTKQADKSCLSNNYQTYAGNANCKLVGSVGSAYSGLNSVTEYQFACKAMNDQCAGLAARAR